jgi:hypothetical protein
MFLLSGRSGKLIALLGVVVASLMVWSHWAAGSTRTASADQHHQAAGDASARYWIAIFGLPGIAWFFAPTVGFLHLDGRLWLIVAWLACAAALEVADGGSRKSEPDRTSREVALPVGLFAVWSCVFWMFVVWELGVGAFILNVDRAVARACQGDPLTEMFSIWRTEPLSEHLFLGWRTAASYASRTPYANHVQPYLLTMYAWVSGVRAASGAPWFVAANTTTVLYMGMVLASLFALLARMRLLRHCRGLTGLLVIFTAVGFVVTTWRFWQDLLRFNTDNPYPLLAAVFVLVYALLQRPARPAPCVAAAVAFVALSPIHLPMLVLAVVCLFGTPAASVREIVQRNRLVISIIVWATVVGGAAMALPRMLIAWKGYSSTSSEFMFRSGLDGDTTYFSSIFQAAWSACPLNCCGSPRPASHVLLPAFLPLVVFGAAAMVRGEARQLQLGRLLMFLLTPYLMSVIFFPQSVSIHPYLYDHLLLIPIVVTGATMMFAEGVRARLRGPLLLAFILFMAGVLMSNLIAVAQALATMP